MIVLGKLILDEFCRNHAEVSNQVSAWIREAEAQSWRNPIEVKRRFASASFLKGNLVIFNLKGNSYRLVTKLDYTHGIVLVKKIGTHAEYDEWKL